MRPFLFAITDIETTGGSPAEGGITEIAVVIHNGYQVIDRFHTLINPGMGIPRFITALTGIDNDTVKKAPSFEDIAETLFALFEGKIFVAHNVNFDHSFLHFRFKQLDLHFQPAKLCSVRYARKVLPGLASYSLGNLCRFLGIEILDRHRAMGDANATSLLFEHLLRVDKDRKSLLQMIKGHTPDSYLPMHVPNEMIEHLPYCAGVYYFKDQTGKVIYVGKAVNLKNRVKSHFTNNSPGKRRQEMLRRIYSIEYKPCLTEMMATVLESLEIRRLWPMFNRSQKRYEPAYGLYAVRDRGNRLKLVVYNKKVNLPSLYNCSSATEVIQLVNKISGDIQIPTEWVWGKYDVDKHNPEEINRKVNQLIEQLSHFLPDFALVEMGKNLKGNDNFVTYCIENGAFRGMAISEEMPEDWMEIKGMIEPMPENSFIRNFLHSAWLQNKGKVILP